MNKNTIRGIGLFVFGSAFGTAITTLLLSEYYRKYYNDMSNQNILDYREYSDNKIKYYEDMYRTQANDIVNEFLSPSTKDEGMSPAEEPEVEDVTEELRRNDPRVDRILKRYSFLTEKKDLDTVMTERGLAKHDHPTEDAPEEDEQPDEPIIVREGSDAIYMISTEEFLQGREDHDKLTITYFEADDTLCDERDGIIPNPQDVVGHSALQSFGTIKTDPDVVYVRNEKVGVDFEIIRNKSSYVEQILGVEPTNTPLKQSVHTSKKPKIVIKGDTIEIGKTKRRISKKLNEDGED